MLLRPRTKSGGNRIKFKLAHLTKLEKKNKSSSTRILLIQPWSQLLLLIKGKHGENRTSLAEEIVRLVQQHHLQLVLPMLKENISI